VIVDVDAESAVPPYEQIRSQLETMIRSATLKPGQRLPAIRQLAADLGLASGTVAREYRELESAGLLVARGRHGTQVADVTPDFTRTERRARLAEAAKAYASVGRQLGVDADELLKALRAELP